MCSVPGPSSTPVDSVGVVNTGWSLTCGSEVESFVWESITTVTNCDCVPSSNKCNTVFTQYSINILYAQVLQIPLQSNDNTYKCSTHACTH